MRLCVRRGRRIILSSRFSWNSASAPNVSSSSHDRAKDEREKRFLTTPLAPLPFDDAVQLPFREGKHFTSPLPRASVKRPPHRLLNSFRGHRDQREAGSFLTGAFLCRRRESTRPAMLAHRPPRQIPASPAPPATERGVALTRLLKRKENSPRGSRCCLEIQFRHRILSQILVLEYEPASLSARWWYLKLFRERGFFCFL